MKKILSLLAVSALLCGCDTMEKVCIEGYGAKACVYPRHETNAVPSTQVEAPK